MKKLFSPDTFLKWLPALITGLILGLALVIFSHRR
jgi:hypothetical protein